LEVSSAADAVRVEKYFPPAYRFPIPRVTDSLESTSAQ